MNFAQGQKYVNADESVVLTISSVRSSPYQGQNRITASLKTEKGTHSFEYDTKQAKNVVKFNKLFLKESF